MRLFTLVCLVVLMAVAFGAKKKSTTSKSKSSDLSTASRRNEVIAEKLADGSIISLSDSNYTKFVVERPRDYRAVLMFTATDSRYQCGMCLKAKTMFEQVATLYNTQYNISKVPISERIVFFVLEVDNARSVFSDMGLETVPKIYSLPAVDKDAPRSNIHDLEIDGKPFMESLSTSVQFVNANANVNIRIFMDPIPILIGACFISLLLSLFVSVAYYDLQKAFLFYQSSKIWIVVSLICFGVGVSGSIYCIIRSAPLLGYSRQGTLSLFAAQGRDQFLFEGVVVAAWTIGCALAYYIIYASSKIRLPILRELGVLFGIALFATLALQLWNAYGLKTPWYSMKETVPSAVWQFLRSSVKKDSNLAKRLLRLSELCLWEIKDFEGLKKKFEVFVIDYLKRTYFASQGNL